MTRLIHRHRHLLPLQTTLIQVLFVFFLILSRNICFLLLLLIQIQMMF